MGGQSGEGNGSGDSNNDSTEGDETDGDAEGSEVQTSPGNGELSDRQKRLLDKAIEKQRKFLNGEVKKSKISKTDNAKVEAANEAGVESREVGSDYEQSYWSSRKGKTNVTVINKLTKKLINSGAFDRYFLSPDTEGSRYEGNRENVMKGVQLGTVLGKRLKVRSEERSLSTPRMKNGKISGRLLHELGMGNINVFEQTQIDKHKPAFIHISIDASGSMNGGAFEKTIISSVAIAKAASMTNNLDVAISFRTCSGDGNSNYPLMMTAYDSRVDKFSKITQLFPHINATGTTPEGLCFESIMNDILKVDKSVDTYFINFSDGAPWYSNKEIEYSGQQAVQHTAKQVKKMTNAGIKVLSFFITSSSLSSYLENFKKMYGKTAEQISIDSLIPLARTLNKLFE
jgi:cobalamin biosynthesis protein CobT